MICGGYVGSQDDDCYIYQDGTWIKSHPLTEARSYAGVSKLPSSSSTNRLIVTGGHNGINYLDTAEILNEDGTWESVTSLPAAVTNHCQVFINSTTVFVVGGLQANGVLTRTTYFYNTETESWVQGPFLNSDRYRHSCAMIKNDYQSSEYSVIVSGGKSILGKTLSSVEILEAGSSAWYFGPELPIEVVSHSMIQDANGGVVLVGGMDGNGDDIDQMYYLSHAEEEWTELPQKLKFRRQHPTVFLVPDEITNCH